MSQESDALMPVEERTVVFYGDEIKGVIIRSHPDAGSSVFIPVRPMCDFLGITWPAQRRRLVSDPVLSAEVETVVVSTEGGRQEMLCIPLDMLNGWLFSINANRVKEEIRDRVLRYQRECYRVLYEAFQEGRLTADEDFETMLQRASPESAEGFYMAQAVVRLARQQVVMEARLTGRLDDYERRLEDIEGTLGDPDRVVTPSQASQISQAVKAIAHEMGKHSGKNEYGGVYGELYRRFEITSYKLLPAQRFDEAMNFLTQWYLSIASSDEVPF